jgi:hypothetical protein
MWAELTARLDRQQEQINGVSAKQAATQNEVAEQKNVLAGVVADQVEIRHKQASTQNEVAEQKNVLAGVVVEQDQVRHKLENMENDITAVKTSQDTIVANQACIQTGQANLQTGQANLETGQAKLSDDVCQGFATLFAKLDNQVRVVILLHK